MSHQGTKVKTTREPEYPWIKDYTADWRRARLSADERGFVHLLLHEAIDVLCPLPLDRVYALAKREFTARKPTVDRWLFGGKSGQGLIERGIISCLRDEAGNVTHAWPEFAIPSIAERLEKRGDDISIFHHCSNNDASMVEQQSEKLNEINASEKESKSAELEGTAPTGPVPNRDTTETIGSIARTPDGARDTGGKEYHPDGQEMTAADWEKKQALENVGQYADVAQFDGHDVHPDPTDQDTGFSALDLLNVATGALARRMDAYPKEVHAGKMTAGDAEDDIRGWEFVVQEWQSVVDGCGSRPSPETFALRKASIELALRRMRSSRAENLEYLIETHEAMLKQVNRSHSDEARSPDDGWQGDGPKQFTNQIEEGSDNVAVAAA